MSLPTLKEMQLQMEVDKLRSELHRIQHKEVTITRDYLNEDLQINTMSHYKLMPYIEVTGYPAFNRGDDFITRWRSADEVGFNEILYKADFVTLTPDARNHILENMLKECFYHILSPRNNK